MCNQHMALIDGSVSDGGWFFCDAISVAVPVQDSVHKG